MSMSPAVAHPHVDIGDDTHAHTALGLEIAIRESGITYDILLSNSFLNQLIPRERGNLKLEQRDNVYVFLDADQERNEQQAFSAYLTAHVPAITIDGTTVAPVFDRVEFLPAVDPTGRTDHSRSPPDARAMVRFPASAMPQNVTLRWAMFAEELNRDAFGRPKPIELAARLDVGAQSRIITFTKTDNSYEWSADADDATLGVAPVRVSTSSATKNIPLLSAGLVFLGFVVLATAHLAHASWRAQRILWGVLAIVVVASIPLRKIWVTSVAMPWQAPEPITQSQAEEVLTELLRNVYRAFDYRDESDVYDVLAASVDGKQLDEVYAEVYASLQAREQGGAVARVKDIEFVTVELDESGVDAESGARTFSAKCRWRVYGLVYHWGHVHDRGNEYRASYTISERDGVWKITGTQRIGQRRLDLALGRDVRESTAKRTRIGSEPA